MANDDLQGKLKRIRAWLKKKSCDAVLLSSQASFSWLTGGRGYIGIASQRACAQFLISNDQFIVWTDNIEKKRLLQEELVDIPCEVHEFNWFESNQIERIINLYIPANKKLIYEEDVLSDLSHLRYPLTETEKNSYRQLGKDVAVALEQTCYNLKRGDSELEVAADLSFRCIQKNIEPVTNLIAADHRIFQYRHPLPTNNIVDQYAMVVVGGRRKGLIASATRLVHFGKASADVLQRHRAVTKIDATIIQETRPERRVAELFKGLCEKYKEHGYDNEWRLHHQGGLTGYLPREYRADTQTKQIVEADQAFAWNPSISGVKSEDTILVTANENEILTRTGDFPEIEINVDDSFILRPDILIRKW
ncbi:M24 family metallopeptidase [Alkalihalobacillus sp. 1P02AB]|uniref:M24 family metallopeptidase n=1 Tax=Alkalihalobacillus sp. 1P02AB TaxID=3132260 RepID=UPI0039A645EC